MKFTGDKVLEGLKSWRGGRGRCVRQADLGGRHHGPRQTTSEEERDPGGDCEHEERGKRGTGEGAREPGGRVRGDRSRVVHVGGDWACAGVEAGAVDGAEHRVNGAGTGTGSGFSVRQRRMQMVWFEGAMEGEEGRTGVHGIMVM